MSTVFESGFLSILIQNMREKKNRAKKDFYNFQFDMDIKKT